MHCFCKGRFLEYKTLESMDIKFDEFKNSKGTADEN